MAAAASPAPAAGGASDPSVKAVWVAQPVWLAPPEVLATPDAASVIGPELQRALEYVSRTPVAYGMAGLLDRFKEQTDAAPPEVTSALNLVSNGEANYLAFEYDLAAAALAEGAGQLSVLMSELADAEIQRLIEARILEALSWLAVDKPTVASEALRKLLVLRPTYVGDPKKMSPEALIVLKNARSALMRAGVGSLAIETTPPGATVSLDGQRRGVSPITLSDIPFGTHQLRVHVQGYDTTIRAVPVLKAETQQLTIALQEGALLRATNVVLRAATAGARPASVEADFATLQKQGNLMSAVLLGLAPTNNPAELQLTAVRWDNGRRGCAQLRLPVASAANGQAMQTIATGFASALMADGGCNMATMDTTLVNFDTALLGIRPGADKEARAALESVPLWQKWWFWAGIAAIATSASGAAYVATSKDNIHTVVGDPRVQIVWDPQ